MKELEVKYQAGSLPYKVISPQEGSDLGLILAAFHNQEDAQLFLDIKKLQQV